ncbi:S1 family peptidase [Promicromonospora kroppenstedtii]|uniref:S1 family peptidase n=1 Tax=Promicromonospora kroppenstedtii TaxID=440482 RepID=UPI0004AF852A|nr:S1 family peptidase [Promicromonospora kroppenstedtii]
MILGLMAPATAAPAQARDSDEPTDAELAELHEAIEESDVEGVAWYTDEAAGEVVVTADSTVTGAERNAVRRAAGDKIGALDLQRMEGEFKLVKRSMPPGAAIYGSGTRCSLGFNARRGNKHYLITAGHCGNDVATWRAGNQKRIGPTVSSRFPGVDYALVRYDTRSLKRPGGYLPGTARVGQKVTRVGSTTGQHSGVVTAVGVTVRYGGGAMVGNLIQTNICAEPGDSGGPLYSGRRALGITSGAAGACPAHGISLYQPIKPVLAAYGVQLYRR